MHILQCQCSLLRSENMCSEDIAIIRCSLFIGHWSSVEYSAIMSKRCHFRAFWKTDPAFASWLVEVKDDTQRASCNICKKSFDIGNMGVAAVKSLERQDTRI